MPGNSAREKVPCRRGAAKRFGEYNWPGNIRELRNVCEQLAVLCENDVITAADLAAVLPIGPVDENPFVSQESGDFTLRRLQKRQIAEALSRASSRKEAAEMLGISKSTLWRKCKDMGLE